MAELTADEKKASPLHASFDDHAFVPRRGHEDECGAVTEETGELGCCEPAWFHQKQDRLVTACCDTTCCPPLPPDEDRALFEKQNRNAEGSALINARRQMHYWQAKYAELTRVSESELGGQR